MVKTRSMVRSKRQIYRSRVKKSVCRKLGRATCRRKHGCKRANGTKRSYCRKSKNRNA
jgi:hypothetical protein